MLNFRIYEIYLLTKKFQDYISITLSSQIRTNVRQVNTIARAIPLAKTQWRSQGVLWVPEHPLKNSSLIFVNFQKNQNLNVHHRTWLQVSDIAKLAWHAQPCYGTVHAWPVPCSPIVNFMHMLDIVLSDNRMHVASRRARLPRRVSQSVGLVIW